MYSIVVLRAPGAQLWNISLSAYANENAFATNVFDRGSADVKRVLKVRTEYLTLAAFAIRISFVL